MNSLGELAKVKRVVDEMIVQGRWYQDPVGCSSSSSSSIHSDHRQTCSSIGLRVNPLVGGGRIAALSTATSRSKFGVPLVPWEDGVGGSSSGVCSSVGGTGTGAGTGLKEMEKDEEERHHGISLQRQSVIDLFIAHPFLTGLMCHVGSQGMSLETMVQGVQRLVMLADEVDEVCRRHSIINNNNNNNSNNDLLPRITTIDIGGGLSVNYDSDEITPTMEDYANALARECPTLFSHPHRRIITEFGKALVAKCGAIVTTVEDVLHHQQLMSSTLPPPPPSQQSPQPSSSSHDLHQNHRNDRLSESSSQEQPSLTAIVHAGAGDEPPPPLLTTPHIVSILPFYYPTPSLPSFP